MGEMGDVGSFTRRAVISRAAAAGAASLLPAGIARAQGAPALLSTRRIGTLAGVSAVIDASRPFVMVGVEWSAPMRAAIELRALTAGGRWTPWVPAASLGHEPDGPRAATLFGEPLWTGSSDGVQLRSSSPVHGVKLHFVAAHQRASGGEPAAGAAAPAAALPLAAPVLDAGPGQPPIIARRVWAAGQAPPRAFAGYGTVKLAFVHHTVNPNGYSAGEVPAMLRAIFDYHAYVRGYFDIAYNFLIDAYGRIWEGRAGGIDSAVIGAQAGAYNTESTGVAMLGTFSDVLPTPPALSALAQFLAWKLSLHGVPSQGRVTVTVDPSGAFYTPFAPGARVLLPRIAGHRDGDSTDCPGNALYYRLPAIRQRVLPLTGTPARLRATTPEVTVVAGTPAVLEGHLRLLDGTGVAQAPLELQELIDFTETTIATVTTGSDGSWTSSLEPRQNTVMRALHRPAPASVSDWIEIFVAPAITLTAQPGPPIAVTGTVSPPKAHVLIELYAAGHPHKPAVRKRVRALHGSFTATLRAPAAPGSYLVVASTTADAINAAGRSPAQPVQVS